MGIGGHASAFKGLLAAGLFATLLGGCATPEFAGPISTQDRIATADHGGGYDPG